MRAFRLSNGLGNTGRSTDSSPAWWAGDGRALALPEIVFLTALFLGATVVRLWGMSKVHSWDEMVYLQNAQVICCGKTNYSELSFRPPLISLLFAVLFLFQHSIYAACISTALLNALAPVFFYLAGRLSVGRTAAILASLLLAFSPFFIGIFPPDLNSDNTGSSLLTDSPALTLITLSFWLLIRAVRRPSFLRFFSAGVALALCILMRFGTLSCVAILLLLPLFSAKRVQALLAASSGLVLGISPYFLWSRLRFGSFFFTLKQGWTHVEGSVDPFSYFLRRAPTIFTPVALAGFCLFLAWQLFEAFGNTREHPGDLNDRNLRLSRQVQLYLLAWLVIEFVAFGLIPHKEPRYIMPAAPPFFLLSGMGLALLVQLRIGKGRLIGAFAVGVSLLWAFAPLRSLLHRPFVDTQVPDEELAGKLLTATVPSGTLLYMSYNYPALAFYTNFRIHELSSIGPALYRDMAAVPPGEILVVYRDAEAPSQSDTAWCDASHKFERLDAYRSFVVYRRLRDATSIMPTVPNTKRENPHHNPVSLGQ